MFCTVCWVQMVTLPALAGSMDDTACVKRPSSESSTLLVPGCAALGGGPVYVVMGTATGEVNEALPLEFFVTAYWMTRLADPPPPT